MTNEVVTLEKIIDSVAPVFGQVLSDKTIEFKREAEFALQTLYSPANDFMRKVALGNTQSLKDSITNVAAIGISLNPAKKQAYLVPRKGGISLVVSYIGMIELAVASGSIRWAKAEVVRDKDRFVMNGMDKLPTHDFAPFAKDRGEIIGVYCVAKTIDGDYLTDTMSIDEVNAIRDRSDAWKAWLEKKKKCPWVTDPGEMIKKTVLKRAAKVWPQTPRLAQAIHVLNTDGGEGIDFTQDDPLPATGAKVEFSLGNILARMAGAETIEETRVIRAEGLKAASANKDRAAYERIIQATAARRDELNGVAGNSDIQDVVVKEKVRA